MRTAGLFAVGPGLIAVGPGLIAVGMCPAAQT